MLNYCQIQVATLKYKLNGYSMQKSSFLRFGSCFVGQNSDFRTLSSVRCLSTAVPDVILQRGGGGGRVVFLMSFVCEHLIKVTVFAMAVAMGKVTYCRLNFLNFTALMLDIE